MCYICISLYIQDSVSKYNATNTLKYHKIVLYIFPMDIYACPFSIYS
jgi:hypothetical protein